MIFPRSLAVVFLLLLLLAAVAVPSTTGNSKDAEGEDDLQYLIDNADDIPANDPDEWLQEDGDDDLLPESEPDDLPPDQIDETHVLVLTASNFSTFLASRRHVMVEFYAPWCGHCQALAPDYAAAAADLAAHHDLALAKVDATEDTDLAQKYDVQGFPTILFFIDGVPRDYTGARTKDAIVAWIDNKLGPGVHNLTDLDNAERILTGDDKAVLAFLDTLSGSHSDQLAAASRLEDNVNFYQTSSPDVAKLFHIDPAAKRPSLVLLKKEEEKLTFYGNRILRFSAVALLPFLLVRLAIHCNPCVSCRWGVQSLCHCRLRVCKQASFGHHTNTGNCSFYFRQSNQEAGMSLLFTMGGILVTFFFFTHCSFTEPLLPCFATQILLFAVANESSKFLPIFKEAAKSFKGKLLFVFVERDNEEVGEPVANYFGIAGQETTVTPCVLAYTGNEDAKKFFLDGEVSLDAIKKFAEGFLEDKLTPFYKSEPVPESNDGDVKVVVGKNLDQIVLDESKDVLLEALEPTYNKLAKYLHGINSLIIAKMDGTTNEHPRAKVGLNESIKNQFWEDLDSMVSGIPISEKLFIGGDLNGHVGTSNVGFERVHGGFGYGSRNQEGVDILNWALAYDLRFVRRIQETEIEEALKRMKSGKAMGPDGIPIEDTELTLESHCSLQPDGFPTILFYPAGKKSFEPITFEGDRTVVEMYKFIKKNAGIPFKLKRPYSSETKTKSTQSPTSSESEKSSDTSPKEEL
ncbi:hypothetical protein PR202_gb05926 [Eleusine coracana subsp. coracana]|uniref:protein disulfide-isomerase n=1 Tax=Eleusine coracana subsp. coracana TaxID=191504 RepID=A0AAV5E8D3_ELECO|nr:hypothetical protein PR202_gb05926 [Eleusine coracana subsp. coracana]